MTSQLGRTAHRRRLCARGWPLQFHHGDIARLIGQYWLPASPANFACDASCRCDERELNPDHNVWCRVAPGESRRASACRDNVCARQHMPIIDQEPSTVDSSLAVVQPSQPRRPIMISTHRSPGCATLGGGDDWSPCHKIRTLRVESPLPVRTPALSAADRRTPNDTSTSSGCGSSSLSCATTASAVVRTVLSASRNPTAAFSTARAVCLPALSSPPASDSSASTGMSTKTTPPPSTSNAAIPSTASTPMDCSLRSSVPVSWSKAHPTRQTHKSGSVGTPGRPVGVAHPLPGGGAAESGQSPPLGLG